MMNFQVFSGQGIIPAYAGQIGGSYPYKPVHGDHPRIRGTNEIFDNSDLRILGSSPHTRDKCWYAFNDSGRMMDHPRIRGTNSIQLPVTVRPSGSSPHTRDKFLIPAGFLCGVRIIPAYAGQIITHTSYCVGL